MKRTMVFVLSIFFIVAAAGVVTGRGTYREAFFARYPDAKNTKLYRDCSLCHITPEGGTARNLFGISFAANNMKGFSEIEGIDSDGDGYTNIDEIKAGTYPGLFTDQPDPKKYSKCVSLIFFQAPKTGKIPAYSFVDGKYVELPSGNSCYIKNDTSMAPLRFAVENLGGTASFFGSERRIDIKKGETVVAQFWIGRNTARIKNKDYKLGNPSEIVGGSTFVPVRALSDSMDAELNWVAPSKILNIGYKAKKSCCEGD